MAVDSADEALHPPGELCAFGRVVAVVDGLGDLAEPVRRPAVEDDAVAVLQEQPADLPGDREASFLYEHQGPPGPLFGGQAVLVFAGDLGRAAPARVRGPARPSVAEPSDTHPAWTPTTRRSTAPTEDSASTSAQAPRLASAARQVPSRNLAIADLVL
ncbi:hypothetical protein ACFQ6S_06590 [Streptomyces sp. NPDC056479]|uniref:hypothetical protein n=1 Tax=Streptomyces sp. NPDC056479 TaxID=3345832 RepID=UPI0036C51393